MVFSDSQFHQTFGYSPSEIAGMSLAALRQAFLDDAGRAALEEKFRLQLDALGRELFGAPIEPPVS